MLSYFIISQKIVRSLCFLQRNYISQLTAGIRVLNLSHHGFLNTIPVYGKMPENLIYNDTNAIVLSEFYHVNWGHTLADEVIYF